MAKPAMLSSVLLATMTVIATVACGDDEDRTPTPRAEAPSQTATASGTPPPTYPSGTVFAAGDMFDLLRLPAVRTSNWPQASDSAGRLTVRFPPGWSAQVNDRLFATIAKPLSNGQTVAICKTAPGWVKADLNAGPENVPIELNGANIVRDETINVGGNGFSARVVQVNGTDQCGAGYGVLEIIPQPPFPGGTGLNGSVVVHFPASAEDIATAIAILGAVHVN